MIKLIGSLKTGGNIMNNFPVAKESFPYLFISGVATLITYYYFSWFSLIPAVFFIFSAFFFRNPFRSIEKINSVALSPADGVIMDVEKVTKDDFFDEEVWKVSIFLNIFNVHINRTPVSGKVEHVKYIPGKFLPAFKSHASEINERNYVVFSTDVGKVVVCQITGFIARRIVCWVKKDDKLEQGERFGLIKFGSCTEIYLPLKYSIMVKKGDKVKGGLTVIGRLD